MTHGIEEELRERTGRCYIAWRSVAHHSPGGINIPLAMYENRLQCYKKKLQMLENWRGNVSVVEDIHNMKMELNR